MQTPINLKSLLWKGWFSNFVFLHLQSFNINSWNNLLECINWYLNHQTARPVKTFNVLRIHREELIDWKTRSFHWKKASTSCFTSCYNYKFSDMASKSVQTLYQSWQLNWSQPRDHRSNTFKTVSIYVLNLLFATKKWLLICSVYSRVRYNRYCNIQV